MNRSLLHCAPSLSFSSRIVHHDGEQSFFIYVSQKHCCSFRAGNLLLFFFDTSASFMESLCDQQSDKIRQPVTFHYDEDNQVTIQQQIVYFFLSFIQFRLFNFKSDNFFEDLRIRKCKAFRSFEIKNL